MKKLITIVILITLLMMTVSSALVVSAQEPTSEPTEEPTVEPTDEPTEEPTEEPTVEPTEEPTEEPTVEPTEEPTVEPTEEPTVEPTEEPTVEPTEEPTVEPTEEPTVEPTEEPTVEPTEEPTVEPTEEPTVEPTEEPTVEPTVEPTATITPTVEPTLAPSEIEAQAYSGSWTSYVAVQNIGTTSTGIVIDWILNGATSACGQTTSTTDLVPGESRRYTPPSNGCGSAWLGSAIVSGVEPLAAVVENMGSQGQLLSEYTGGAEPTTETLIVPQTNNVEWDPSIGISNAGDDTANVTLTFLNRDGTTFDTYATTIPAQSGVQIRVRDVIATGWKGSIQIDQTGTAQPLYAVNKAEREIPGETYPVSIAYEAWKVSDAAADLWIPAINKRMGEGVPTGQNVTVGVVNPDANDAVDVDILWIDRQGTTVHTTEYTLAARGTQFKTTRDISQIPDDFSGSAQILTEWAAGATQHTVGDPAPVIALAQPWVATEGMYSYKSWAVYTPVDPTKFAGTTNAYAPVVHKQSSEGGRAGNGWCSSIVALNLNSGTTYVNINIYDSTDGSVAYSANNVEIAGGAKVNWYTLKSDFDAAMGSDFFGGAVIEIVSGGPIAVSSQQTGNAYGNGNNATSDAFGFYNGVSQ